MASCSAKERQNDRDKKGGPETKMEGEAQQIETKMEGEAQQIETETMEKWSWNRSEQPHLAKGKRKRQ